MWWNTEMLFCVTYSNIKYSSIIEQNGILLRIFINGKRETTVSNSSHFLGYPISRSLRVFFVSFPITLHPHNGISHTIWETMVEIRNLKPWEMVDTENWRISFWMKPTKTVNSHLLVTLCLVSSSPCASSQSLASSLGTSWNRIPRQFEAYFWASH